MWPEVPFVASRPRAKQISLLNPVEFGQLLGEERTRAQNLQQEARKAQGSTAKPGWALRDEGGQRGGPRGVAGHFAGDRFWGPRPQRRRRRPRTGAGHRGARPPPNTGPSLLLPRLYQAGLGRRPPDVFTFSSDGFRRGGTVDQPCATRRDPWLRTCPRFPTRS